MLTDNFGFIGIIFEKKTEEENVILNIFFLFLQPNQDCGEVGPSDYDK